MNEQEQTLDERSQALQARIECDLDRAVYDDALKAELSQLPTWQLDCIFANVLGNAEWGQRGDAQSRVRNLQRAVRDSAAVQLQPTQQENIETMTPMIEAKLARLTKMRDWRVREEASDRQGVEAEALSWALDVLHQCLPLINKFHQV